MTRTAIAALIAAAALFLSLFFVFRGQSPFGRSNTSFSVEEGKEISSITISDNSRELILENRDGKWFTGSGSEARKNGIAFLTAILSEMSIKSPVSDQLFNDAAGSAGISPVKVRVYGGRKLLKSFLVYKTGSNQYGNIMKLRESAKPFIVHLPGFEGDIGSVFTAEPLYWEPYVIFNQHPSEIESIAVEYPSDTASSFTLITGRQQFSMFAGSKELKGFDLKLATRYVSYFTFIPFDEWAMGLSDTEQTRIQSETPLCLIRIKIRDGGNKVLTLIPRRYPVNDTVKSDENRLYGRMDSRDQFFIVRYFDIDPVLKKRSYFFTR